MRIQNWGTNWYPVNLLTNVSLLNSGCISLIHHERPNLFPETRTDNAVIYTSEAYIHLTFNGIYCHPQP